MFGLGNIFSGLGSLFTMPNLLSAMDFLGKGFGIYQQIDSLMNPPEMPDYDRLDMQGNQPQPMPDPAAAMTMSPQAKAMQAASARSHMAERGIGPGGAFNNPQQFMPGYFGDASMYANVGEGQALPYEDEFGSSPYGDFR